MTPADPFNPEWRWWRSDHGLTDEELRAVKPSKRDTLVKDTLREEGRADEADEPRGRRRVRAKQSDTSGQEP